MIFLKNLKYRIEWKTSDVIPKVDDFEWESELSEKSDSTYTKSNIAICSLSGCCVEWQLTRFSTRRTQ